MAGGILGDGSFNTGPLRWSQDGRLLNPEELAPFQSTAGDRPKRQRAHLKVYFNGMDLTSKLEPFLLAVRITLRKVGQSTCSISIDARYAKVPPPPDGAKIYIEIGWPEEGSVRTFEGFLSDVIIFGQRKGGRVMEIEGTASDQLADGKTPITGSWGEGKDAPSSGSSGGSSGGKKFSEVAQEVAQKMGLGLTISQQIGDTTRQYWSIDNEPPLQWLERTSKELGGSFAVDGAQAGITSPGSGLNAAGEAMTAVEARVGVNVLAWAVRPKIARAQWASSWHGFFDRDKSKWMTAGENIAGSFGGATAKHMGGLPVNDEAMAKTGAAADNAASVQGRGTGWINIDGEPKAIAGGPCTAIGLYPGVDGGYTNKEVEHSWFRGGGFLTRLDVEDPSGASAVGGTGDWNTPH